MRSSVDLSRALLIRPPPIAGARWLIAALMLVALLALFWSMDAFAPVAQPGPSPAFGPALFFSAIIAYVVPVCGYISERTAAAIGDLSQDLDAPPKEIARWRSRIHRKPVTWLASVLALGVVSGLGHNLLLAGSLRDLMALATSVRPAAAVVIGTSLVWIVVTVVIAALIDNALVMNRAARACRVELLVTRRLRPFASVAVISTLAIVGAQALFPLMFIAENLEPVAYLPGLFATGAPMLLLAALPVAPVHRRIAREKRRVLAALESRIAASPLPDPDQPEALRTLTPLLAFRREIQQISEWPFDAGVVARLGLYLIIPPLTWVGAALIENLVDTLL